MNNSNWTVAYASVAGNLHTEQNIPCQDNCVYHRFNSDWGLGIVCDGAGSSSHSHIGSKVTAQLAHKHFMELVQTQQWHVSNTFPSPTLWQDVAVLTLRKVKADLEKIAEEEKLTLQSLACTIIVVIHSSAGILVTHIGDGRAGYFNGKDWKSIINPFHGSVVGETVFITSDIWEENKVNRFVYGGIYKDTVEAFVLLTDGCEKGSFEVNLYDPRKNKFFDPNRPYAKFFNPNVEGLKALYRDGKSQEEINKLWSGFLKNGTRQFKTETDDKTMILGVQNPL